MSKHLRIKGSALHIAVQFLVICVGHTPAFAEPPPAGNAERAQVDPNALADRHAVVGRQSISPRHLPFFQADIQPNLSLARHVPGLENVFQNVLNKKWFTTKDGVDYCPDPETITVRGQKVGCQTNTQVIITSDWWNQLAPTSPPLSTDRSEGILLQNRLDTVRHALCVGVVLSTQGRTEREDLYDCFDALTRVPPPLPEELRAVVQKMGYAFPEKDETNGCFHELNDFSTAKNLYVSVSPINRTLNNTAKSVSTPSSIASDVKTLSDGFYDTPEDNLCSLSLINNTRKKSIILAGISAAGKNCSNTSSVEATRTSANEYTYYDSSQNVVVSEQTIKACTPQADNPIPCDKWLYSKSRSLLIRVGDIATSARVVNLYNSNAFRSSAHQRFTRNSQVIADKEISSGNYLQTSK